VAKVLKHAKKKRGNPRTPEQKGGKIVKRKREGGKSKQCRVSILAPIQRVIERKLSAREGGGAKGSASRQFEGKTIAVEGGSNSEGLMSKYRLEKTDYRQSEGVVGRRGGR